MAEQIVTIIRVLNNRYYPIVVLTDREKRSDDFLTITTELKREILEQLATKKMTADIRIGVADRMIENWILAAVNCLNRDFYFNVEYLGIYFFNVFNLIPASSFTIHHFFFHLCAFL